MFSLHYNSHSILFLWKRILTYTNIKGYIFFSNRTEMNIYLILFWLFIKKKKPLSFQFFVFIIKKFQFKSQYCKINQGGANFLKPFSIKSQCMKKLYLKTNFYIIFNNLYLIKLHNVFFILVLNLS